MLRKLILIALIAHVPKAKGQLSEADFNESRRFCHNYARAIDDSLQLSGNCKLIYSHNTMYKMIHLVDATGKIHLIDVRYRGGHPGYVKFYSDHSNDVLFEQRGSGSGNPACYFTVNKYDGIKKWMKAPFQPE